MTPADITNILDALSRRPLSRPLPSVVQLPGRLMDDVEEGSGMYGAVDPNGPEPMTEALACLGHLWEEVGRPPIPPFETVRFDQPCSQEYWLAACAANSWLLTQHATAPTGIQTGMDPHTRGQLAALVLLSIAALWTGESSISSTDAVAALPEMLADYMPRRGATSTALPSVTP